MVEVYVTKEYVATVCVNVKVAFVIVVAVQLITPPTVMQLVEVVEFFMVVV